MNWEAIGAVGEITGAIAVVATLGYLALQTKQANKLARANTILQLQAENRAHRNALAQDPELSDIVMRAIRGDELTEHDLFRYQARSDASFGLFEGMFMQFEAGMINEDDFARYEPVIKQIAVVSKRLGIRRSVASLGFRKYLDDLTNDA